jgi:hypothetical protein
MEYILQAIITALNVGILFLIYRQQRYFGKKGENQAVIEDIGEITEIVESIKQDLANQGDLIKAQLSHKSKHELELKNEERQAYFDFNKKISAWLFALVRFSFSGYSLENFEELKSKYNEHNDLQYDYDVADGHLSLFNSSTEFHEKKLELETAILNLEHNLENHIRELYYAYSYANIMIESTPNDFKTHAVERDKVRKTHSKLSQEHHDKFIPLYKTVISVRADLIDLINKELKRIENL